MAGSHDPFGAFFGWCRSTDNNERTDGFTYDLRRAGCEDGGRRSPPRTQPVLGKDFRGHLTASGETAS